MILQKPKDLPEKNHNNLIDQLTLKGQGNLL